MSGEKIQVLSITSEHFTEKCTTCNSGITYVRILRAYIGLDYPAREHGTSDQVPTSENVWRLLYYRIGSLAKNSVGSGQNMIHFSWDSVYVTYRVIQKDVYTSKNLFYKTY
jgi:hypothetical protein